MLTAVGVSLQVVLHMDRKIFIKFVDILARGFPGSNFEETAFDATVVFPLNGQTSSSASKAAERNKIRKYRGKCAEKGIVFEPVAVESFGRLYPGMVNLVQRECNFSVSKENFGRNNVSISALAAIYSRYWFSALSFELQRSISVSILSRLKILTSSRLGYDYYVHPSFVVDRFGLFSMHFSDYSYVRQFLVSTAANISQAHALSTSNVCRYLTIW